MLSSESDPLLTNDGAAITVGMTCWLVYTGDGGKTWKVMESKVTAADAQGYDTDPRAPCVVSASSWVRTSTRGHNRIFASMFKAHLAKWKWRHPW